MSQVEVVIRALAGFRVALATTSASSAVPLGSGETLPIDLTQRRILEALVLEDGIARSAEEIRRRAQVADANTIGQSMSRLRAAWSKVIGDHAKEVLPEARASRGYRLHLPRSAVDVWAVDDLQRAHQEQLATAVVLSDWEAISTQFDAIESLWSSAAADFRANPSAVATETSDLGKRVAKLAARRVDLRRKWVEVTLRTGLRADLVAPALSRWLTAPDQEASTERSDPAMWRLWIEATAEVSSSTSADLEAIVALGSEAGIHKGELEALVRSAAFRLAPIAASTEPERSRPLSSADGSLLIDLNEAPSRKPIVGLEINVRSRFVGRNDERAQLAHVGARALLNHSGHLITVTGEPGVGKSRLVAETIAAINTAIDSEPNAPREINWYVGKCRDNSREMTCFALGEIVKSIADVTPLDSADVAVAKLETLLDQSGVALNERAELLNHLGALVGGQTKDASPTERFCAWSRSLAAIAQTRPIALIFEDLHWADDLMVEFLDFITEQGSLSPVLVLATARPEYLVRFPTWGGGGRPATSIALRSLSAQGTEELLDSLGTDGTLSAPVRAAIIERSGGNPLFAEELALMVEQSGAEDATVIAGLPPAVELVVATRLDQLGESAARVAYAAATIGRVFWSGAIETVMSEVWSMPESTVRAALAELVRADLVQRGWSSSMPGQLEYTFWHAIVRDVAESRVDPARLREVHLRGAEWLRVASGERLADVVEQLADHYIVAFDLQLDPATANDPPDLSQSPELGSIDFNVSDHAIQVVHLAARRQLVFDRQRGLQLVKRALMLAPFGNPLRPALLCDYATSFVHANNLAAGEKYCQSALAELRGGEPQYAARVEAAMGLNISFFKAIWVALLTCSKNHSTDCDSGPKRTTEPQKVWPFFCDLDGTAYYPAIFKSFKRSGSGLERLCEMDGRHKLLLRRRIRSRVDPQAVLDWYHELAEDGTKWFSFEGWFWANLADLEGGLHGPRAARNALERGAEFVRSRGFPVGHWLEAAGDTYSLCLGELSRASQFDSLHESAGPIVVIARLDLLGLRAVVDLIRDGTTDERDLDELRELVGRGIGPGDFQMVGIRAAAFAELSPNSETLNSANLERYLEVFTKVFELRFDRVSILTATMRLHILRVALLVDRRDLAQRLVDTSDPLSECHRATDLAIRGYLMAYDGKVADAVTQLEIAADAMEAVDLVLDAAWVRLHIARFAKRSKSPVKVAFEEAAMLERFESMGAVGIHSGMLDGWSVKFTNNFLR